MNNDSSPGAHDAPRDYMTAEEWKAKYLAEMPPLTERQRERLSEIFSRPAQALR